MYVTGTGVLTRSDIAPEDDNFEYLTVPYVDGTGGLLFGGDEVKSAAGGYGSGGVNDALVDDFIDGDFGCSFENVLIGYVTGLAAARSPLRYSMPASSSPLRTERSSPGAIFQTMVCVTVPRIAIVVFGVTTS